MVGMTICLCEAYAWVCASVCACTLAMVLVCVARRPAMCDFPVCAHVSVQAGREAARRFLVEAMQAADIREKSILALEPLATNTV